MRTNELKEASNETVFIEAINARSIMSGLLYFELLACFLAIDFELKLALSLACRLIGNELISGFYLGV